MVYRIWGALIYSVWTCNRVPLWLCQSCSFNLIFLFNSSSFSLFSSMWQTNTNVWLCWAISEINLYIDLVGFDFYYLTISIAKINVCLFLNCLDLYWIIIFYFIFIFFNFQDWWDVGACTSTSTHKDAHFLLQPSTQRAWGELLGCYPAATAELSTSFPFCLAVVATSLLPSKETSSCYTGIYPLQLGVCHAHRNLTGHCDSSLFLRPH